MNALKISPSKNVSHRNSVCSRHFKPEDFKPALTRLVLKRAVIPSLHLQFEEEIQPSLLQSNSENIDPGTSGTTELHLKRAVIPSLQLQSEEKIQLPLLQSESENIDPGTSETTKLV